MALSLEKFIQQLEASGVLDSETLKGFLPPNSSPANAEALALELIRQEKLTKFQAKEISRGEGKSLVLGNYVLLEKIGAGGMGQVFKARHRVMDRLVAVKVLPSAMTRDRDALARFHREVKAAAKLTHPNIVTAYDADQAGGVHFLVMELVAGNDLSAHVKKSGPFPAERAIGYILQAAKGLEFAHKQGVVHRDIKPANLLLDREGTVKILDMGLARIHEDRPQAELTSTGTVMGTVDYMAPEQALDTKSADARADIYSLGCSLHYLLAGKSAYDGDTLMAKLLAHRDQPIPRLGDYCEAVSEQVETVFRKMVAKSVEDRYQSVTELLTDLAPCVTDRPPTPTDFEASRTIIDVKSKNLTSPAISAESRVLSMPRLSAKGVTADSARKWMPIGAAVLAAAVLAAGGIWFAGANWFGAKKKAPIAKASRPATTTPPKKESAAAKKPPLAPQAPGLDRWLKDVATMPAENQVQEVGRKLKDLNPEFDGRLFSNPWDQSSTPVVEGGKVVELTIFPDKVANLSPVRAFSDLRILQFWSRQDTKQPLDLSALKGMKIGSLKCFGWNPLPSVNGLPISELVCIGGGITDLTPITGMQLKSLGVSGNWEIQSLKPLQNMPLITLSCDNCLVADLSPLRGMKLTALICHVTQVTDLSPLAGMPLEVLTCERTRITDLSPLASMKLKKLSFTPSRELKGVQVIRQMESLTEIGIEYDKMIPSQEFWKKYDAGEFGNR